METGLKIGDIMTRDLFFVSPDTDLISCCKTMIKKRVGNLLIKKKDSDTLEGILTEKDIVWAVLKKSGKDLKNIQAKDIMKKKVVTIKPSADITEAMDKFKKKKIRRLPVVQNGKLIGIITIKDILKIDPGLYQLIAQSTKIREETRKLEKIGVESARGQGICEECGEYDVLYDDDGQSLCEECYDNR